MSAVTDIRFEATPSFDKSFLSSRHFLKLPQQKGAREPDVNANNVDAFLMPRGSRTAASLPSSKNTLLLFSSSKSYLIITLGGLVSLMPRNVVS